MGASSAGLRVGVRLHGERLGLGLRKPCTSYHGRGSGSSRPVVAHSVQVRLVLRDDIVNRADPQNLWCVRHLTSPRCARTYLIQQWVDGGAVEGSPRDLPRFPPEPIGGGWENRISSWRPARPTRFLPKELTCFASSSCRFRRRSHDTSRESSSGPTIRASCTTPTFCSIEHRRRAHATRKTRPLASEAFSPPPPHTHPDTSSGGRRVNLNRCCHRGCPGGLDPGTDLVVQLHMKPAGSRSPSNSRSAFFSGRRPPRARRPC